jgi:uncharacterized membrane protein
MVRRVWLAFAIIIVVIGAILSPTPVLGQEDPPSQSGSSPASGQELLLFTRFPSQEIALDDDVSFELKLRANSTPQMVRLGLENVPDGWTTTFRGGGRVIQAAYVDPEEDVSVDLTVEPAADTRAGTYRFSIIALDEQNERVAASLPIELTLKEKLPPSLNLDVDLPMLRGTPDTTFRYNVTLKNEGDQEAEINLVAEAPQGFQVSFKLSGQDVTSVPLAANESKSLSVEVKAFRGVAAGAYPINVLAKGGELEATTRLMAEVAGQPELTVTAPDGRLSAQAYADRTTPIKLIVQNTGSAPVRNVTLNPSAPSGWEVTFEPEHITEIPTDGHAEITAHVQPADQAVAGDYMVTINATPQDGAAESAEFRITVLTSTLWGLAGVGFIAIAVAVVGLAVMRFGRR